MPRRRCLWATSQPWHSPFRVSAHHYARYLAEHGWDVAFLSHPISPLHLVWSRSRGSTAERLRNWRRGGETACDGHVFHYCPLTLCPPHDAPLLRSARVLDFWPRMTIPRVRGRLVARAFDDVDLLVVDSERYGFLFDTVTAKTTVFRRVDAPGGFAGTPPSWIERGKALARRADHVVVTSAVLAADATADGAKSVIHVPNGVETDRFVAGPLAAPDEYASIPAPRVIYVGAIEEWFDVELVRAAATALPHVAFVLIGPATIDIASLRALANVHLLGARPYDDVPRYVANADVGIIPFRSTALTRSIHPIKLYEYMACGLPVVAVRSDELEQMASPARLSRSTAEFVREVSEATEHPVDRQTLIAFARQADWRQRAVQFLDAIGGGDAPISPSLTPPSPALRGGNACG